MTIIEQCKQDIIEHYKQQNIDISTKEKRIALTPEAKKEIFNLLTQQFMFYSLHEF